MKSIYGYDVLNNRIMKESNILPTEEESKKFSWLWAINNKYGNNYHAKKSGKWILALDATTVDAAWLRVKDGIKKGKLWKAKVSPKTFTIMIYTKDYEDIFDIVRVLDYLEKSKIKASETIIYYRINKHSRTAVYKIHHNSRPWIYSSQTIREE